ncbi:hypothetical protein OAR34_00495 [Pelagibacteraceae bacterium]|nr:hypothetical protein [Pelagibacteraceae bacterium]|tara:strand:- start:21 stop:293 length:273 start_codon:yes stop_codon:yes gene_type:complete
MKKLLITTLIFWGSITYGIAEQKCRDLPGYKKIGKDSTEFIKCLKSKKLKLNTDSTLTDVITGKKKLKIPNPLTGLKNVGNAIKPTILDK